MTIRKATRKQAKLRLGISGPSGAGKTMGALLLAYGITKDWDKIGLIDTEEGSGELYVGIEKHGVTVGEFLYTRISGKFPPKSYVDAILAMENAGAEVIIVDSLTHAWAGTDGLLDKQGKIAAKSGNSYTAWRDVTPEHNALVNAMLQSRSHIIATMRAKVEYAMQKGDDGKYKIQKMGMAPIQREGMEYEFTTFFDIDTNHRASTTKDRTDLFSSINASGNVEKLDFVITPETGEKLLGWLNKGDSIAPLLSHEIESLLTKITLDEGDAQDKFIIANKGNLRNLPDETLIKIKTYIEKEKLS